MYDLNGKTALITGAGGERGMGHAMAVRLAREGANVIVNDITSDPNPRPSSTWGGVHEIVREIEAVGGHAMSILADITDATQVDSMVREAIGHFGQIDILVNNAAARQGPDLVPVVNLDEEVWDLTQRVNVKGTFLCSRAVARQMIKAGKGGKIITIASTAGKLGIANRAAYSASKFALIGFTQSLALELALHRINVNAICPGSVDTQRLEYVSAATAPPGMSAADYHAQYLEERASENPMSRVAHPEDIANMAAFLASSESDYLTGLSLTVSGGSQMN